MGAGVLHDGSQRILFQVDVAGQEVLRLAVAVVAHQHIVDIQELIAVVNTHLGQRIVELVDLLHAHVGIAGVIFGDGGHGGDDDVGVGIGRLDGLQRGAIVGGEVRGAHGAVGVVGAHHHDDAAGLHLGQRIGDGIAVVVALEIDGLVGGEALDAQALHGNHLIQLQQAVLVVAVGVGVAHKDGLVDVGLAGVFGLAQHCVAVLAGVKADRHDLAGAGGSLAAAARIGLAAAGFGHDDAHHHDGDDQHKSADAQHDGCLLLLWGERRRAATGLASVLRHSIALL